LGRQFREDRTSLEKGAAADSLVRFSARMRPFRTAGIYRECSDCPFRSDGRCPGGCLAAALGRFRKAGRRSRGCNSKATGYNMANVGSPGVSRSGGEG
jgi:hypothetical protein